MTQSISSAEVVVRQAFPTDLDALVPLFDGYRQFYGRASDPDSARKFLKARFEKNESAVFIAYAEETAAGFTQLYPSFSSVSLARVFILNDLFVDEQVRRKGIASKLIGAAATYARGLGAVRLSLSTATTNDTAQALYRSLGWTRDEQFHVYHYAMPA